MKSTNRKEHGSALTKLQKFLTFIGSILGIVTACITIYTFSITSNATTTTPSNSVTTESSTNRGHMASINQIGEKSVTIPSTEITSPNEKYSSSTTENIGSLDDTETSSNQEIQTSTTTSNSTESSTETTASSSQE